MLMDSAVLSPALLMFLCLSQAAPGQDEFADDAVRQETQRILSDAEFRYFDHLDDSAERPPYRSAMKRNLHPTGGDGGKESGTGKGAGSKTNQKGSEKGSGNSGQDQQSPADDGMDDSSTSVPMGAVGAIGSVFGAIFHGLAYLVLIAVCGLIVYLIVLAVMSRESGPQSLVPSDLQLGLEDEIEHSPGELPADAYLSKARELADQRQYREAIAYLLLGGMSAIERADLIRHRRGLTLRDYLRVLRGREPQFAGFRAMIRLYEPIGFGRRVASHQTFQDALVGYEQAVTSLV